MRSDLRPLRYLCFSCLVLSATDQRCFALGSPFAKAPAYPARRDSVLYLAVQEPNKPLFAVASSELIRDKPNLVIITHGWYEREPWAARMALAIQQRADGEKWQCGWYDWRRQARRLFPSTAAKLARDSAGPLLGRKILQLSQDWKHIHLIGHSAGAWVINEAARVIARQTPASIHLTFLDAYVPNRWDETELGCITPRSDTVCWVEHYFTRDAISHLTENVLTHGHNVDISAINPGFNGHKFPWHWYHATIVGKFVTRGRHAEAPVMDTARGTRYGFVRAREVAEDNWTLSVTLPANKSPVGISSR